jgi:hypothetical protein
MTTHNTATNKYIGTYLVVKTKLFLRISVKNIHIDVDFEIKIFGTLKVKVLL